MGWMDHLCGADNRPGDRERMVSHSASTSVGNTVMAEAAKDFFVANPDAEYWYYSPTLRVPNPRFKELWDNPRPWPVDGE